MKNRQDSSLIKERSSNLELLRILSMILIIMHHYAVHGGFNLSDYGVEFNKVFIQILSLGGKLGVNCFVLITGYFMINSSFKLLKLFKILFQVLFYSISISIIFYGFGIIELNLENLIKSIFPTIFNMYWFSTVYIVLYLLTPYINKFIKTISQKEHFNLILLLTCIWSIIPTITNVNKLGFSGLGWFILLYLSGAYIKLYPNKITENIKYSFIIAILSYLFVIISVICFDILGLKFRIFNSYATYYSGMNKLPIFICSVALIIFFKNLKIKNSKVINALAMTTFGIYLIHDNNIMRGFLWKSLFKNSKYIDSPYLFLHAIIAITLTFGVCALIDYTRIQLLEKPLFGYINKINSSKNKK